MNSSSHIFMWLLHPDGDCSHGIKRCLLLGRKVMTNLDSILKSRDIVNKGLSSQGYGFSCGHVWMWELDCEESWVLKNWYFWTVVLEKTLESPNGQRSLAGCGIWSHKKSGPSSHSYCFSSSHVWMWELDYKESWEPKNWCFWTVVLEKTPESLLDCKEIKPVNPKGNLSWIFIERSDAEAETPIFWPPHVKRWLTGKDPDAGRD